MIRLLLKMKTLDFRGFPEVLNIHLDSERHIILLSLNYQSSFASPNEDLKKAYITVFIHFSCCDLIDS